MISPGITWNRFDLYSSFIIIWWRFFLCISMAKVVGFPIHETGTSVLLAKHKRFSMYLAIN